MNQLISNVLMQTKPTDAVIERPLTLVEKLEREIESLENSFEQFAIVDNEIAMVHTATIAGLKMAINIVKQHTQPPSEVQEKIYQREMDKIKFCGCGCILPDGSAQCSDCEAQNE